MNIEEIKLGLTHSDIVRAVSDEILWQLERCKRIQEELISVYEEWRRDRR